MLYLVSGASRSGKTMIARKILEHQGIPHLSLDWLVMGFTNGMPHVGIHDKLFPDEIAERMWPFVDAMCESMLWTEIDHVIEGEAILPSAARTLINRHPQNVKACFLGYSDVDVEQKLLEVKTHSTVERDWLIEQSDDAIRQHIENMVAYSRKVRDECRIHGVRYFDTSAEFMPTIDRATRSLFADEK